jgi:aspartyl protease family protein
MAHSNDPDAAMRSIVTFAALAIVASITVPRYAAHLNGTRPISNIMAARATTPAPAQPPTANSHSVVITPNENGHFEVEGRVDGRHLEFMVDTGATIIALTAKDAATLGIHPAEREFTAMIRTANGAVRAAPVQLNMVEINDIMVRDVAAVVMPDDALSENLLGLTFLSRLRRYEFSSGKLVLEQ